MKSFYTFLARAGMAVLSLFALSVPGLQLAAQISWINSGTGDWLDGANWSTGNIPPSWAGVEVNTGTAIHSSGSASNASVSLSGMGDDMPLLRIEGTGVLSNRSGSSKVGGSTGSTASVAVSGSGRWETHGIEIGFRGDGYVSISGSGHVVNGNDLVFLGFGPGTSGTLAITDSGKLTSDADGLRVGEYGRGLLTVADNGSISTYQLILGFTTSGTGLVRLADNASVNVSNYIIVGDRGMGTLEVGGNALLASSNFSFIGYRPEGSGHVLIKDNARWQMAGTYAHLMVGLQGTGTLTLLDNSVVQTPSLTLGDNPSGSGHVLVRDSGKLENSGVLYVGNFGKGTLDIADNGHVSNGLAYINSGTVRVAGDGVWTSGTLHISGSDMGTVLIEDNASVSADAVIIGFDRGTGELILNGGVLATGSITTNNGKASFIVDSGTLRATADNESFVSRLAQVTINEGGMTVDSDGYAIGITSTLAGGGALIKTGGGTLSLGMDNSYAGGTEIREGTLLLTGAGAASTGAIHVGAVLELAFTGSYGNAIAGSGTVVLSGGGDFGFNQSAVTGAFNGTVDARDGTFFIFDDTAESLLRDATLRLGQSGSTALDSHRTIGGLDMAGGVLHAQTADNDPGIATTLTVGTLTASSGTVVIKRPVNTVADDSVAGKASFFDQSGTVQSTIVSATTVNGSGVSIDLVDDSGNSLGESADIAIVNTAGNEIGTASYGFHGIVDENGLHISYGLTQLDANSDATITLANTGTSDVLNAKLTGEGGFDFSGAGVMTVGNAGSSYTGTTRVTSGTVSFLTDNAFGATAHLALSAEAGVWLNEHSQNVGTLDAAAGSTLHLGSGTLTILNGGAIDGTLAGSDAGALIVGGTLGVSGANTGMHSTVGITANAQVNLDNMAGLGDGMIQFLDATSALVVADNTPGVFANGLSGNGQLLKQGAGEMLIAHANAGFAGSVDISEGRLVAGSIESLGSSTVNVRQHAAYELSGVEGTLRNTINGDGLLALTNGSKVLVTQNDAIAPSISVSVDNAALVIGTDDLRLGNVAMGNRASLRFAPRASSGDPFRKATITSLTGASTIVFNVDFDKVSSALDGGNPTRAANNNVITGGAAADHLVITGTSMGGHALLVNGSGLAPNHDAHIELISFQGAGADNAATYHLVDANGNPVEYYEAGLRQYELVRGDAKPETPDASAWYLSTAGLSFASDIILATASVTGRDWYYTLDSLHLRMGDIRADLESIKTTHTGNVWLRGRGYHLNAGSEITGRSFEQDAYGMTTGADRAFAARNAVILGGAFVDIGRVDRDFGVHGDGNTDNIGAGLYASWLHDAGWYLDLVAKADRLKNKFDAIDTDGSKTSARYNSHVQGLSLELGRRLQGAGSNWWFEPSVQAAVAWLNGTSYEASSLTSPAQDSIHANVGASRAAQYRVALRFGHQLSESRWLPYGKLAAAKNDTHGGRIIADGQELVADPDGCRFEAGLGTAYRISKRSQLYFDYEYAKAKNYERPWAVNIGYRQLW